MANFFTESNSMKKQLFHRSEGLKLSPNQYFTKSPPCKPLLAREQKVSLRSPDPQFVLSV